MVAGGGIKEGMSAENSCRYERGDAEGGGEGVAAFPETCSGATPSGLGEVGDICPDVLVRDWGSFLCEETWQCASGSEL